MWNQFIVKGSGSNAGFESGRAWLDSRTRRGRDKSLLEIRRFGWTVRTTDCFTSAVEITALRPACVFNFPHFRRRKSER